MRSLNLDPSAGQATSHNIPAGPCSRLKASRSEHAPVSKLLLSTWPDILSCLGLVSWAPDARGHTLLHTQKDAVLGFMLHWCFLDKGLAFSTAPGPSISCSRSCLWHLQWHRPLLKDLRVSPGQHCSNVHMASPIYITCQASAGICPGCLGFTALVLWIHLCSTKKCPKWGCPSAKKLWETLVSDAKGHIQLDFDIQILFIVSETNDKNIKEMWNKK